LGNLIAKIQFTGVIVKSGVWHDESSGGLIACCYLDTIFEFDSGYHLGEIIETA
jgi:hypothetical protein